jgi:hypothetical protein
VGKNLRRNSYRWIKAISVALLTVMACLLVESQSLSIQANSPNNSCPADIKTLTDRLLEDLPSYANRVIQRARKLDRVDYLSTYVIVAGRPEFEPLPLTSRQYTPILPDTSQQVFFTTLERRYSQNRVVRAQNYHWLFLTQAEDGWRLVTIYTQFGVPNGDRPPTPPQETSDGVIGQAVRLWLRDCRALQ